MLMQNGSACERVSGVMVGFDVEPFSVTASFSGTRASAWSVSSSESASGSYSRSLSKSGRILRFRSRGSGRRPSW